MNLSPAWVPALARMGHDSVHWSSVGPPKATDSEVLNWAKGNGSIVFTHDLDFGAILAATQADSPSVIQMRMHDPTPGHCEALMKDILRQHAALLEAGALISVDEDLARARILPRNRNHP
jgi:predicted nuclease of predicted toxin-antitoxin system